MAKTTYAVELNDNLTLPPGRFPINRDDLNSIWGFNNHRQDLMSKAWEFVDTINTIVPIRSVWIGGSFLSNKEHPNDVDMTLIVDSTELATRQRTLLSNEALCRLAAQLNAAVDPYVLGWHPRHEVSATKNDILELADRGYWDDWWLRARAQTSAEDRDTVASPRKGYVEVMVSGYTQQ